MIQLIYKYGGNMENKLIEELTKLRIKEKAYKRFLDLKYYDNEQRSKFFNELKEIKKDIRKIKFKIRLEKELKR